ncbi:hypothetical protein BDW59DRAFT_169720 [Aspergillus cavernicola]|uniref:Amidohydrolase-related domain-containing protein n=1 Tax=Aspergillus cavernicola TaxID=176166 RepID=A0ABR4IUL8_9EURO
MLSLETRLLIRTVKKNIDHLVHLLLDIPLLQWPKLHFTTGHTAVQQNLFSDKIPPGAWDSHMHVTDPQRYPLATDAQYTPKPHSLTDALEFETSIGLRNIVLVQPSIYGTDNSCMLVALMALGPQHARAVVTFDPETINHSTLEEWHKLGVRGVRVNTQSVGRDMGEEELIETLQKYAEVIQPYKWVLQLYVLLRMAIVLEKIVPELGVRVCVDHFGCPDLKGTLSSTETETECERFNDPYVLPGFRSLVNLLREGNTYVKLSAPYRISSDRMLSDLESVAKELLRVGGMNRAVFASDWPHTRFEGLDIRPFMEVLLGWCGNDEALIERVFRGNAETLWG